MACLLSDLIPNSVTVSKLEEIKYFLDSGKIACFFALESDCWRESIGKFLGCNIRLNCTVYIAGKLKMTKVLLVTDVDGIYIEDPKNQSRS